jgi:hypothetical protein
MEKTNMNERIYQKGIDSLFSGINRFNFEEYVSNMYNNKVPDYIKKYLKPEAEYISELSSEMNNSIETIKENFYKNIKEDPKIALEKTLEEILFPSKKFKEDFSRKISESVEELGYTSEIALAEAYKIWKVKYNTPGVGYFAKKKLKEYTGREDLPKFEEAKDKIKEIKENTYSFLEYLGFENKSKLFREEVMKRYQKRMKSYGELSNGRRLLAYDLREEIEKPTNASEDNEEFQESIKEYYSKSKKIKLEDIAEEDFEFISYKRDKERQRKMEYTRSNYNSWFEKILGYISYIFGF